MTLDAVSSYPLPSILNVPYIPNSLKNFSVFASPVYQPLRTSQPFVKPASRRIHAPDYARPCGIERLVLGEGPRTHRPSRLSAAAATNTDHSAGTNSTFPCFV